MHRGGRLGKNDWGRAEHRLFRGTTAGARARTGAPAMARFDRLLSGFSRPACAVANACVLVAVTAPERRD